MPDRALVVSASNLLSRGFMVVPTDRHAPDGAPVNALFAVARAIHRVIANKPPVRAVAVLENQRDGTAWPEILEQQVSELAPLLRTLGIAVVEAHGEAELVASYVRAARDNGDDVTVVGVDKRYAQLVGERVHWYDANKDVRYTPEIVRKRFNVPPEAVGEWLALVGDDSGNDVLPGIKGIGAKGATSIIEAHGSIERAMANLAALEKRIAKALETSREDVMRELARGRLSGTRPLPIAWESVELVYQRPDAERLNALYERLGFAELLSAESKAMAAAVCETKEQLDAALLAMRAGGAGDPLAIHMLTDDPAPVREPITGLALANGSQGACWVPRDTDAWTALVPWLEDPDVPKVGHDLGGTIAELSRAGVALRGIVGDSACASHLTEPSNWAPHDLSVVAKHVLGRALPEEDAVRGVGKQRRSWGTLGAKKTGGYGATLADASAAVWKKLAPTIAPQSALDEYLALTSLCARMELTGIPVDAAELDRAEVAFAEIERELDAEIEALAGHPFNINSSKQLGEVLFEELKLPVALHTKTGWSTSIEALERIEHAHPIVSRVLRWRALRRLRDNWVIALRRNIDSDGRVHSRAHPARSFSGLLVNTNPDLGRVPGRTPEMARIRRAFVAPPGRLLMTVDFNQLGLHVLAHLTKDPALVEPLRMRADMHVLTASAVLERAPEAITPEERQLGKVINFATFAGQGASALALQLGVSAAEAKAYLARFDQRYAKVRAFQDAALQSAREQGYIVTIAGRRWPIGGLESLDPHDRSYAERLARRATHEASVQDVSRRALLEADRAIAREKLGAHALVQVHDEVLFDVPENELEVTARVCADAMRGAYDLEVPLVVGVWAGRNWADLEPV